MFQFVLFPLIDLSIDNSQTWHPYGQNMVLQKTIHKKSVPKFGGLPSIRPKTQISAHWMNDNVGKPQVVVPPSVTHEFIKQKNLLVFDIDLVIIHSVPWEDVPSLTWFVENSNDLSESDICMSSPSKHHPLHSRLQFLDDDECFRIRKIATVEDILHAPNTIINHQSNKTETIDLLCIEACSSPQTKYFTNTTQQKNCPVSKRYYAIASKNMGYLSIIRKNFFAVLNSVYGQHNVVLYTRGSPEYANFVYNGLHAAHAHIYGMQLNKTIRFKVDCVISASDRADPAAIKKLEALVKLPEIAHQFSPLHAYHSIMILDDDADKVWSHEQINQLYHIRRVPVFLIHVPPFFAWTQDDLRNVGDVQITQSSAKRYSSFLMVNLFKYFHQETFFKDFSIFLRIYQGLSTWKKIQMCMEPGKIGEFNTKTCQWIFMCPKYRDPIRWWKIERHK